MRRVVLIDHPDFQGSNGVLRAKDFAETLIAGLQATAEESTAELRKNGIPNDQIIQMQADARRYRVIVRKVEEDQL